MNCEIDYDIVTRKIKLFLWIDDPATKETYSIILSPHQKKSGDGEELTPTLFPKKEGEAVLKALATGLQKSGYLPESATKAELKAVREELEIARKRNEFMLHIIADGMGKALDTILSQTR